MFKIGEGGFNGRLNELDDNEFYDQSVYFQFEFKVFIYCLLKFYIIIVIVKIN